MEPHGGFEHNAQSLRIVDVLEERYPDFRRPQPHLGGARGHRQALARATTARRSPSSTPTKAPTLEAQIVDFADEIAYNAHDIDDGLKSRDAHARRPGRSGASGASTIGDVRDAYPRADDRIVRYQTTARIIDAFVADLIETTERRLRASAAWKRSRTSGPIKPKLVDFSAAMASRCAS